MVRSVLDENNKHLIVNRKLDRTISSIYHNFSQGEERANQVNKFFDQEYFKGNESLIRELLNRNPDISFEHIKDEGINLGALLYNKWMRDFAGCIDKITNTEIKKILMNEIHDRVQNEFGGAGVYGDFSSECPVPGDENVLLYFQNVVDYLNRKEGKEGAKKTKDILGNITITNEDINGKLTTNQIPSNLKLSDASIPEETKNAFDNLLSFEIGKKASYILNRVEEISNEIGGLFTNSLPAINTIVGESSRYKYDESKLGLKYRRELAEIQNDSNISDQDKNKKINDLKWKYYLIYLKSKNKKIGEALEKLYNNNFDYSKLYSEDPELLKGYLDVVVDSRLDKLLSPGNGTNEILKLNFGNLDKFKQFYKDLANPDIGRFTLEKATSIDGVSPIIIPVEKTIVKGENLRLKDINQFGGNPLSYDAIPIRYTIKKSDIDNLKSSLSMEDMVKLEGFLSTFKFEDDKYIIDGNKVGMLIYLFFVLNSETSITEFNPDDQKKIEELFGRAKETNRNEISGEESQEREGEEGGDRQKGENGDDTQKGEKGSNISEKECDIAAFKEQIESKFKGPGKFENGSVIIVPAFNGELPGGKYDHLKLTIEDINEKEGTFKCRASGCELRLKDNLEGKTKKFRMNQGFFNDINEISKNSDIRLLPNPHKGNFRSYLDNFNNEAGTNDLGFPGEGVTWNKDKFMRKFIDDNLKEHNEEVEYFGVPDDDKATYKVEYNPIKNSFRVSSVFNGEKKGKDGKTETKRFSYKRDMDWATFLVFFNQRGLIPQTKEESDNAVQASEKDYKIVNGGQWKLNWFSFINVKNGLKDIFGNLNKKIDEYSQKRTEKFKDLTQDSILNLIAKFPLPNSLKYAVGELQKESYNEKVNGARKEIEGYLEDLKKDDQFADTFDQVPACVQTTYGTSYKKFLINLFKKKGKTSNEDKRKAAALLLANIDKGGSPYRGLTEYENQGLWVKAILGNKHYEIFMAKKQEFIKKKLRNAGKNKDQLQSVLATCEMDYIINNVTGANGKLPFGCKEIRGLPGNKKKQESTKYWPNPSKIILSEKFGNELKNAYQGWLDQSSVEDAHSKISHNDFEQARADFDRLFKTSRFPGALGNLKKMFDLAKNDDQKAEYQRCFLVYLLSGVLDIYGKKKLRKQAYLWGKTMFFLPGMLAKNTGHSEQVAALLDDFSGGDFSKNVKSYFRAGNLKNGKLNIENLIGEIDKWWDVNKMKKFEQYSKTDFLSKSFSDKSALGKLKASALDTSMENIDDSLLDNPVVVNSGGILSNINVVQKQLRFNRFGHWEGIKDPDEAGNIEQFWEQITSEINSMDVDNDTKGVNNMKLLLRQYCSWFNLNDGEEMYKWLKTAYYRKKEVGHRHTYTNDEGYEDDMGLITNNEINSILWYTFKGKVMSRSFQGYRLPKQIHDVLNAFQKKFETAFENGLLNRDEIIRDSFHVGNKDNIKELGLGSRTNYNWAVREGTNNNSNNVVRNRISDNFTSGNFINHYIANLEKSLKNLPFGEYTSVTTSTVEDLISRFTRIDDGSSNIYNKNKIIKKSNNIPTNFELSDTESQSNINEGRDGSNQPGHTTTT